MPRTLLIVDDDPAIRKVLDSAFTDAGYLALSAQNGEEGLELVRRHAPDLLVLDVVMPRVDGLEVCRRVRADPATAALPILFLTSQSDEIDRVVGLELGADDYVAKPFALREVLARVKALLRRAGAGDAAARVSEVIRVAGLRIDCAKWTVTLPNDLPVKLTKSEFTLLRVLAERPGRVRTRESGPRPQASVDPRKCKVILARALAAAPPSAGPRPRFVLPSAPPPTSPPAPRPAHRRAAPFTNSSHLLRASLASLG
ncbi:MAG: response regulator transcription factor [Planctomycetes bacterium]|nr:response regulator transcription factor [Planctomycetota bacterium]